MDKDKTYYNSLRKAVEETAGKALRTPNDFLWLQEKLRSQLGQKLSLATLERFWGYAKTQYQPSRWTLDILSRYVGCKDFEQFCHNEEDGVQSDFLDRERISVDSLGVGARIRLNWQPNRQCVVEYLGKGEFRIVEAHGTKLSAGDTFVCHVFIQDEPLYLSDLCHKGMPPVSYVAGKKTGVKFMMF